MASKVEAARLAAGAGIPAIIGPAAQVAEVLSGKSVGTLFHPTGTRITSRLLWLAHATSPRGRLILDPGAVAAIGGKRVSLLPVGVTAVEGDFLAGDPVELIDGATGLAIARGLVAYDAAELPVLLGRRTQELAAALGPGYERELVHRDDLVVL
jgi:glutamate 5-kinase